MAIVLRQICLVAHDLTPITAALHDAFHLRVCFRDPHVDQFGLHNVLMPIGSQFLEVVAPMMEDAPAQRYLARRGGDGGYMVICQTTDPDEQAQVRARADEIGVRRVLETTIGSHSFLQFHPADMGGSFLEADWDSVNEPDGQWAPANGRVWRHFSDTSRVTAIVGAEITAVDPAAVAQTWSHVLGLPMTQFDGPVFEIALANATLRFIAGGPERYPGLSAITLRASQNTPRHGRGVFEIGGIRIDVV